jgi:oxygen-independent coproporphyrinogen-3 oxidase
MKQVLQTIDFNKALIERYDTAGPRYTSYPTAVAFTDAFTAEDYKKHANLSNEDFIPSALSLYFHIPFCDTVCFYCACNKIATKDYSKAETYLDYLYREIEMQSALYDQDRIVEQLHFGGGTPTFLTDKQVRNLFSKIRKHFNVLETDDGDYSIEIDPRAVSKDTIGVLRDVGFNRFSLGVQDVDEKVQKAINRIQPMEQTLSVIEACRDNQARSISVDLIYGLPHQTAESFDRTLDFIIDASPDRVSVFNYAHMPNRFKAQRRISADDLPSADEKLEIFSHSIKRLTEAGYVYIGMDHFAKPDDELAVAQREGSLHRNFQGYTTHANCDLIGMGVSSISSVAGCYSQNAKDLDSYYLTLGHGELPVIKGVALDADDGIRRKIIQQLSCHFQLNYKAFYDVFKIDFKKHFARELQLLEPMGSDGLLALTEEGIDISASGRLLIRNVCMVFDVSLRKMDLQDRFSKVI